MLRWSAATRPARARGSPRIARGETYAPRGDRSEFADLSAASPPYHRANEEKHGGGDRENTAIVRDQVPDTLPIAADGESKITDSAVPDRGGARHGEDGANGRHAEGTRKGRHERSHARNESAGEKRRHAVAAVHLMESLLCTRSPVAEQ